MIIHWRSPVISDRPRRAEHGTVHQPHAASDDDPIGHLDVRNELGIREGGFGIMLAKGLVDEFHYNDRGNEVTLIKRFEPHARKARG